MFYVKSDTTPMRIFLLFRCFRFLHGKTGENRPNLCINGSIFSIIYYSYVFLQRCTMNGSGSFVKSVNDNGFHPGGCAVPPSRLKRILEMLG